VGDAARIDKEKRAVAEAAAELVEDGMAVGLGTGSTVAHLLGALARRRVRIRAVATSPRTERAARELGLGVEPFDSFQRLDIAIDGADMIGPDGWLVKGRGGAHTREKIVAAAADRFVVIVSSDKVVEQLAPPVPLELLPFALPLVVRALDPVRLRVAPPSPDGGVIADHLGPVDDPERLAARLDAMPGVVEHGLFPPAMVSEVLLARRRGVERIELLP
jgi:ribose 5-phosphate isomerase A